MNPGSRRNRKRLGPRLARQDAVSDIVDGSVPGNSSAHAVVEVHGQHSGRLGKGHRVAADPRAKIDNQRASEAAGLVAGHGFGGGLLQAHGIEPHPVAAGELRPRPVSTGGQSDRGGDDVRRRELSPPGDVGGARVADKSRLGQ